MPNEIFSEHEMFATPEHRAFRASIRKFVQEELVPRSREFDEMGRIDKSLYPKMGELGMLGIRYDPRFGGAGLDWSFSAILAEEVGCCDNAGVAMGIFVQTDMATPALAQFGSDELRERWLAPAIRGEAVGAIAVTEPTAGSDVSAIRTRAVRDGDDWVINGSKTFITNAATADFFCLLAVSDPEAGYGGFTQIIVPTDTPGISYTLLDKIGNWGSDTGTIYFEDVRVPISNTIGDPGRGFQQQMVQFQDERLIAVLASSAAAMDCWEKTRDYCQQRIVFGKPLTKFQVNQFKFVDMLIRIQAARELGYACVRKRIDGEDATREISMAKIFCIEAQQYVATTCMQMYGGAGYLTDNPAGRMFVDSRLASIGGGADEVMKQVIAKSLGF
ncbi:MAG TPA: acyl-CoA dehydrogenase family protein [Candidatus Limnocylindrales bacterium]|nr:acyl-CoA dehydrogenase family protein [Candidatus Limnocylindrales bacterium]